MQGKTEIRFALAGFEADFFIPREHIAFVSEHDSAPQVREECASKPVLIADKPRGGLRICAEHSDRHCPGNPRPNGVASKPGYA